MSPSGRVHGLIAEFEAHEPLVEAARRVRAAGYRRVDAYTPFPVEDLPEAMGWRGMTMPIVIFCGGAAGGLGGYFMEWFAMAVDYPLNVGGRPFHSWPMFIPVMFELTVLGAALAGFIGVLALCRLPRPHHPVFNAPNFHRATQDRFFLCIERADPRFDPATTRAFLESLKPLRVSEVEE